MDDCICSGQFVTLPHVPCRLYHPLSNLFLYYWYLGRGERGHARGRDTTQLSHGTVNCEA
jgi:hypothetical protein